MGGEKTVKVPALVVPTGSPPRRRGKVIAQRHALFGVGITPAQTGKRAQPACPGIPGQDHPRVGGEKSLTRWQPTGIPGSPPRRRGKEKLEAHRLELARITPAQAGKSVAPRQKRSALWDHPRVGGEKYSRPSYSRISMGSPPRGRGKVVRPDVVAKAAGITPAWAGKSLRSGLAHSMFWDHPRVGGEKLG